ncbi:hypothetical protein [Phytoactinopolyspora halotolerans]|uniref:DUF4351 domain-containing protein n=1 Tax=Phytoactinopolyspora halotolerans TaxID=1981512 RepID=A0A6L9SFP8_9ACTN|nr:hypothetical protein [Phytoactinopolyspora halotolerans]NEE03282.1 hypothetical protein [Phytoactinopolyspora halotolerans]
MAIGAYEVKSDFLRRWRDRGLAEGEAKGEARTLLRVLAARGISVPEDIRVRITECTDLDQLDAWTDRAATATSIDDIFE